MFSEQRCCRIYPVDYFWNLLKTCDALRDLIPLVQFKQCEKHSWRSDNFSKVAGYNWKNMKITHQSCILQPATLLKVSPLYGCFSHFLNCTNGTKSRKVSHIVTKIYAYLMPYLLPFWSLCTKYEVLYVLQILKIL